MFCGTDQLRIALSFDCYGTLIDWGAGIVEALRPWSSRHGITDEAVLEAHAAHETMVQSEHPTMRYPDVLAATVRRVAAQLGVDVTDVEQAALRTSVPDWPAFPDSAAALAALHARFRLVILSNIDRRSFAASARRLGTDFDLVVTAEDVGSYKPSAANFAALLDAVPSIGVGEGVDDAIELGVHGGGVGLVVDRVQNAFTQPQEASG